MITPTDQEPAQEVKHIWWDVCNCESCLDEAAKIDDDDEDLPKKRKSSQQKLKRRYEKGDPTVGLLGEPSGKFDIRLYQSGAKFNRHHQPHKTPLHHINPAIPLHHHHHLYYHHTQKALIYPPSRRYRCFNNQEPLPVHYSQDMRKNSQPSLAFKPPDSRTKMMKDKKPNDYQSTGHANTISPAEATLNWQSENVVAQNKVLVSFYENSLTHKGDTYSQEYLSSRVRSLESIIKELRFRIQELHREIIQIIRTSPTTQPSSSISQKEVKKTLKNQLQDLEQQHKQKRITSLIDDPWRLPSTAFEPTFLQESQSIADVVALTKTPDVLPIQKIQQSISPEAFMSIIYSEFIGSPWEHTTHAREEFLKMKCCSFQKKDLEKHYDRMSQRFYCLNGVDDVNLKQNINIENFYKLCSLSDFISATTSNEDNESEVESVTKPGFTSADSKDTTDIHLQAEI
ncbi:hypothetical protein Tco_0943344 [Tanacetum coccineum]